MPGRATMMARLSTLTTGAGDLEACLLRHVSPRWRRSFARIARGALCRLRYAHLSVSVSPMKHWR